MGLSVLYAVTAIKLRQNSQARKASDIKIKNSVPKARAGPRTADSQLILYVILVVSIIYY